MDKQMDNIFNVKHDDFDTNDYTFAEADPFNKSWDELREFIGLDKNFKRKTTRQENKENKSEKAKSVPIDRYGRLAGQYSVTSGARSSGREDVETKQINPGEVYRNGYGLFDVITPPYNLYELANFYDSNFANHAAVDAKVANTVGLGYEFRPTDQVILRMSMVEDDEKKDKAKKKVDRVKAEMQLWLESMNDDDSFSTTMEKVMVDLESTGNGYLEIGRTTTGEIGYVGHIPSTTMRVRRHRDGYCQIIQNRVVYFRNYGATNPNPITDDPRPNEVIHFKSYSPLNTFYGVPDIIAAFLSLQGDQLADQYNIDYFKNKATPRYIVLVKGAKLSAEAEDRLFRFLQTGLKGQNHRTLYVPLPADSDGNKVEFELKPVENQVQEASFDKYHQRNRDDILMAHQVPLSKLGGVDTGVLAAALAQDRTFKEQVTRPAQREIEKFVNKIIKEKTDIVKLSFKELTLTDEQAQSQILERYVKTQVMTPNEARVVLDLPAREGGNDPFQLSPQRQAEARNELMDDDERASERNANESDSPTTVEGRNPKGEGNRSQ